MGIAQLNADQQRAVGNASTVANLDMAKFNEAQQVELANSKFMQSMVMTDFNANQQAAMQNATAMATMDLANADARTKVAVTNAQSFLKMDMANLNNRQQAVLQDSLTILSKLASATVLAGPPNASYLFDLRYKLITDMPVFNGENKARAREVLYLASLIDGLQDGRYIGFADGLLLVTSRLLGSTETSEVTLSLVDWLVSELPAISAQFAVDFASVDPRLNAVMTAAHTVLGDIASAEGKILNVAAARVVLADAVAQMTLLIPDMAYYFDTPVRSRIIEGVNTCVAVAVAVSEDGVASMTRAQFDACMASLLQLAQSEIRLPELSGNMNGPFTTDALRRELSITPWQRINYGIGYLHQRYSTSCQAPAIAMR